ncbi:MAG: cytochrome c biogenesis protein CcsA [Cyclobacteriaceae bacterium]|jgi:heme exporter protein C
MLSFFKKSWWKYLCMALLIYTTVAGLLVSVPRLSIVNETIRALYFHVPMWFAMVFLFGCSVFYSVQYLRHQTRELDFLAVEFANTGLIMGILGILTGMLWANYTWGSPWHGDPKQNGAAIALLVYLAYFVLRGSLDSADQRARLSAVYNIFAFAAMVPLIFVIPRLQDSMHPGSGGNPGFNVYDLDSRMRLVFYPAVIAWILAGVWIAGLQVRMRVVKQHLEDV